MTGFGKRMRGRIKRLLPYGLQRGYAYRSYGIFFPSLGPLCAILPFGLVCMLKHMDPDHGVGSEMTGISSAGGVGSGYGMNWRRRRRFLDDRAAGLEECRDVIARNSNVRILVVLHLYYPDAWPVVRMYLENLATYRFELVVTIAEGARLGEVVSNVREFAPSARIIESANAGRDIWPFVSVVNGTDLDDYDIILKLHTKGARRPSMFAYGQVFKRSDWFFNLFDGVLGGKAVHRLVDELSSGRAKLCAAENLIVADPPHKQRLVRAFCETRGIRCPDDYRFVAGSCFAARTEVFKSLKAMRFRVEDFESPREGVFSAAHAIERVMCFPAKDAMTGFPVNRREYPKETDECARTSSLRLLADDRVDLDDDFFLRVLEPFHVRRYEIAEARLGDLHRRRGDGSLCHLEECAPFRYLCGDREAYEKYCTENKAETGFAMSPERFESLIASMSQYNARAMPVVFGPDNIVMDGQHRCCVLLKRFGRNHVVDILRIY